MKVFLTGATGVMGMNGMEQLLSTRINGENVALTVLARPGKINERKLDPYIRRGVKVIWGDLLNSRDVARGVAGADVVLHVGGMVSPAADRYPELTYRVNTESMRNVVDAVLEREKKGGKVRVVYVGSVSQYGSRTFPTQWGRTGDPVVGAAFDSYALSKCDAERILAESGLKEWVSLRQTGIIHVGIFYKATDPIAFHVPVSTALEWISDRDSGALLVAVCRKDLPRDFFNNFYNVGGGASYRMSNYDFMKAMLRTLGCPAPEKIFNLNWFATRNFHGMLFEDSDSLDNLLHFRSGESFSDCLDSLKRTLPFYFRLAPLAPSWLMKGFMKRVALKKPLGTLYWIRSDNNARIEAAFGGHEAYDAIPDWKGFTLPDLLGKRRRLDHGYDESKPLSELTLDDLRKAAEFRGGKCLAPGEGDSSVDPYAPLEWECSEGHRFLMRPHTILKGGHWCPQCLKMIYEDPEAMQRLSASNSFLAQLNDE